MDKFLTFQGQQPIYLGDIDFMQTAVGKAFKNLLISFTGDADGSAILSGVEISKAGSDVSWTDGVVAIEGDILPVTAGSITGGAESTLYFQKVSTLSGSREMGDGTTRQCWQTNSANVVTTATDYAVDDFSRVGSSIKAKVYGFENWLQYGLSYAVFANCGGAWMLSFRRLITEDLADNVVFDEDVEGLPADIVRKIGIEPYITTRQLIASLYIHPFGSGSSVSAPYTREAIVDWSVGENGKLHFEVLTVDNVSDGLYIQGTIIIPIF